MQVAWTEGVAVKTEGGKFKIQSPKFKEVPKIKLQSRAAENGTGGRMVEGLFRASSRRLLCAWDGVLAVPARLAARQRRPAGRSPSKRENHPPAPLKHWRTGGQTHELPVISVIECHCGKNKCGKRQFAATPAG
jgi:hypothetical protein